jgi:hypothetical protein
MGMAVLAVARRPGMVTCTGVAFEKPLCIGNFVDVREGTFDSIIVISYVSWSSWSYSLPVCMRIGGEKKR